jgi:hypothetical protein
MHAGSSITGRVLTFSPLGWHAGLAGCARRGGGLVHGRLHLAIFVVDFSALNIDSRCLLVAPCHSMDLPAQTFILWHPRRL